MGTWACQEACHSFISNSSRMQRVTPMPGTEYATGTMPLLPPKSRPSISVLSLAQRSTRWVLHNAYSVPKPSVYDAKLGNTPRRTHQSVDSFCQIKQPILSPFLSLLEGRHRLRLAARLNCLSPPESRTATVRHHARVSRDQTGIERLSLSLQINVGTNRVGMGMQSGSGSWMRRMHKLVN